MKNLPAKSAFVKGGFLDQGKSRRRGKIIKKIKLYNAPSHDDLRDGSRSDSSESPFGYSTKALYSP
jgi:hypothetical protein